jgi:hypothetical protein
MDRRRSTTTGSATVDWSHEGTVALLMQETVCQDTRMSTSDSSVPSRRDVLTTLLAGLAGSTLSLDAEAQSAEPSDPSVYIPKAHLVQDRAFLHAFMREFSFIELVTTAPTLRITHIPSVLAPSQGKYGTIFGHISAQNDQVKAIRAGARAVAVFPPGTSRSCMPRDVWCPSTIRSGSTSSWPRSSTSTSRASAAPTIASAACPRTK